MSTPNLFQQAKQAMELRTKVKKIQKELESQTVDYENAGVIVTARGDMTIASIKISPETIDITRVDKLERTVLENTNRALKKAKDQASAQMQKMTKEMGLDGLLGG
jgi:DNA-binding YbaB/EbfC family protein